MIDIYRDAGVTFIETSRFILSLHHHTSNAMTSVRRAPRALGRFLWPRSPSEFSQSRSTPQLGLLPSPTSCSITTSASRRS